MSPPLQNDALIYRQDKRLVRYLRNIVYPFSSYYRKMMDNMGVDPRSIRSREDLARLPFTTKQDLVEAASDPERRLDFLLRPTPEELKRHPGLLLRAAWRGRGRIHQAIEDEFRPVTLTATTGRSSSPVSFLFTKYDMTRLREAGKLLAGVFQGSREDRVLNMFPFAPHLAFWLTHEALLHCGIFGVSSGGGKTFGTEGNIRLMLRISPTILIGMPTFLYHVLHQAVEEGTRCESIKVLVLGGEKVPEGMRAKLRALCESIGSPNVLVIATYGFTEAKMAWGECLYDPEKRPSGYHIDPDTALIEIIDPDTGEVQPLGSPGEIVYTPIDARGTVVLRYRTGDIIDGGLYSDPCPYCGRHVLRLSGRISRQSEIREVAFDKIKGTLIDFNELEHVLDSIPGIGAWVIELKKANDDPLDLDELIVHITAPPGSNRKTLIHRIREQILAASEISPNDIEFHSADEIRKLQGVGVELKERKIVDNRPKATQPSTEGASVK